MLTAGAARSSAKSAALKYLFIKFPFGFGTRVARLTPDVCPVALYIRRHLSATQGLRFARLRGRFICNWEVAHDIVYRSNRKAHVVARAPRESLARHHRRNTVRQLV